MTNLIKGYRSGVMEKIDRSFSSDLPRGEFFIDDLEKIYGILSGSSNRVTITINEQHEIRDIGEIETIQDDEIKRISMVSQNPQITVDLDRKNSSFSSGIDNRKSRSKYEKIHKIMQKRKFKKLFFQRYPAILGILFGIAFTYVFYIAILGITFTLMSTPGLLIFFLISVGSYSLYYRSGHPSKFNICREKDQRTFWQINKDDMVRGAIVALSTAVFVSSISMIITGII
jgi:hypothetical protein